MKFRKRVYEIIELAPDNDKLSMAYDVFMMIVIFVSIIPLAFLNNYPIFDVIDRVTVTIFIIDYALRLMTADYKLNDGARSFVKYPFTVLAIIDLLSILPSLSILSRTFKLFKIFRLFRTFKVLKIFKAFRYSRNIRVIKNVFIKEKELLSIVVWVAVAYVLISALVILNVEPQSFENYFDAVYWATVSLTTMGYGDIYPVTTAGRFVTMVSSFVGIAVVALPAGIITSGLIDELRFSKEEQQ